MCRCMTAEARWGDRVGKRLAHLLSLPERPLMRRCFCLNVCLPCIAACILITLACHTAPVSGAADAVAEPVRPAASTDAGHSSFAGRLSLNPDCPDPGQNRGGTRSAGKTSLNPWPYEIAPPFAAPLLE